MFSKGVWNHQHEKRLSALLDYQKEFGVTPLAVLGPGIPKWASSGPSALRPSEFILRRHRSISILMTINSLARFYKRSIVCN